MGIMQDLKISPGLLASKFFQPVPTPNWVERTRLNVYLNEGLQASHPLTLVSAPAGYGKSTLVAEWVRQVKRPVAWLSLEEGEDDPLRFFSYFITSLRQIDARLGVELNAVLAAGQLPPTEVLVATLVNDLLKVKSAFICVLDDFQFIQDKMILEVLNSLITQRLDTLHLVLVTREDPALPLARLRAKNQLTEIRAADLRFDEAEIECFLCGGMGLALSEQDILHLAQRTEGWAAGLQLAAIAMKSPLSMQEQTSRSAFIESLSGSHRFILGYLTDEVLKVQTPEVQTFLLQTSILTKLNGELCDALTGHNDSAARLENLLAANLFIIPLDDEGYWYRYHHLFSDLLQNQLRRSHPQQVTALHQRASQWYETHNMPLEAIEHALAAGEYSRVVNLLEQHGWDLLNLGHVRKMESWIQAIPAEWRGSSPRSNLGFAWMHMLRGHFGQVVSYLQQSQLALERLEPTVPQTQALQAECLALQANFFQIQGKVAESIDAAQRALQLVAPENLRVVGLSFLGLGAAYRQAGDFEPSMAALQNAIHASREAGEWVTEMLAVSHLTLMSLQYGRLHFAAEIASQSIERMERHHAAPPPIVGRFSARWAAFIMSGINWTKRANCFYGVPS